MEYHEYWITTDKYFDLHVWDIFNEMPLFTLKLQQINARVFDIIELVEINIIAVGSVDKKVTFWDFYFQKYLFSINMPNSGIHTMVFSGIFQVLITAGYENAISLYKINKMYSERSLIGQFKGHLALINTL